MLQHGSLIFHPRKPGCVFGREHFSRFPVPRGFWQRDLFLVLIPKAKTPLLPVLRPPVLGGCCKQHQRRQQIGRASWERRDGHDTSPLVLL